MNSDNLQEAFQVLRQLRDIRAMRKKSLKHFVHRLDGIPVKLAERVTEPNSSNWTCGVPGKILVYQMLVAMENKLKERLVRLGVEGDI